MTNEIDNTPSYYANIPATARYDKRLTLGARMLYGEVTALANTKGYAWPSNKYFARLYDVNNSTISRWINQLVSFDYLSMKLIYKKGTKQIEKRYLNISKYPIGTNAIPIGNNATRQNDETITDSKNGDESNPIAKMSIPYTQKRLYPIGKNEKDNNTSINTTSTNKDKEEEGNSKTKINSETQTKRKAVFEFWENNGFGSTTPTLYENIGFEVDDFKKADVSEGGTYELIKHAMVIAVEYNARNWRYVQAVLNSYHQKNIKTVEQVEANEKQFKNKQSSNKSKGQNSKQHWESDPNPYADSEKLLKETGYLF